MTTKHTPQSDKGPPPPQQRGATAAEAAPVFATPPPLGPMLMSPEQFRHFMDTCVPVQQAQAQVAPVPVPAEGGPDFPNVSSVAVKLPTFWTTDPELWFLQTESVFKTRTPKVTRDETKFDHAVTALPAEALNCVQNIIRMPATTPDRYERLKAILQSTFGKTPAQKHVELIDYAACKEPVLDIKPSNMLLHIETLSGDNLAAFQRSILLNRLPNSIRTVLSTSSLSNADLAKEADQMMETFLLARPGCTPSSIMAMENMMQIPHPYAASSPAYATPAPTYPQHAPPLVPQSAVPPGIAAVQRQKQSPFLCFFHAKFGAKAYNCKSAQCPMHGQTQRRPQASGNGRAGR